jgi:hypothetical protein
MFQGNKTGLPHIRLHLTMVIVSRATLATRHHSKETNMQFPSSAATATIQHNLTVGLDNGQLVKVTGPVRVGVVRGTVWVTQAGRAQDLFLRAGDTLHISRNGHALVEAQVASQLQVTQARHGAWVVDGAVAQATRASWAGIARRVAQWVRQHLPARAFA